MGFALAPKDERIRLPAVSLGHCPPLARRKSGPRNTAIKLATPDYPNNEWVKTVCKVGGGKVKHAKMRVSVPRRWQLYLPVVATRPASLPALFPVARLRYVLRRVCVAVCF